MFSPLNDADKVKAILNWDGARKINISLEGASEWTDEELSKLLTPDQIATFRKNLQSCGKTATERKFEVSEERIIEVLPRCVKFKGSIYVRFGGIYLCGTPALRKLAFEVFRNEDMDRKIAQYVNNLDTVRTVTDLYTRYIKVGSKFFDTVDGIMVETAPDEFRTFGINRDVDFRPMRSNEGKSPLIKDFNHFMGEENFDWLMHYVAWMLTNLRVNKVCVYITGKSRSMKGTFTDVCAEIGIAPEDNSANDIRMGCEFQDDLGRVLGIYPIIPCNDAETINWTTVKSIHSDRSRYINQKGIAGYHVPTRGFLYISTNETVNTGLQGIAKKMVILETKDSFWENVAYEDEDYVKKLSKESFDEFICILLTYASERWSPFKLEGEIAETNERLMWDVVGHEKFIDGWTSEGVTPVRRVCIQYLAALNHISEFDAEQHVPDYMKYPSRAPTGLIGKSYNSLRKSLEARGFKICFRKIKGESTRCFQGSSSYKPPVEDGEPDDLSDFQGAITDEWMTSEEVDEKIKEMSSQ